MSRNTAKQGNKFKLYRQFVPNSFTKAKILNIGLNNHLHH